MKIFLLLMLFFTCPHLVWGQAATYVNHTELGLMLGKDGYGSRANLSFQTFHGVRINPSHEMGFFVGVDHYNPLTLIPFGMGWRGILHPEKKFTPYAALDLGYNSTALEKKLVTDWNEHSWYAGGLMYHPALGFRIKTKGKAQWSFGIGYKRQVANYYNGRPVNDPWLEYPNPANVDDWNYLRRDKMIFHNLVYRLGLVY